jgi:phosphatidylserine decarboxylase
MDDTHRISHIELTSMLDSLGSTLSAETINSFFTRRGKKLQEDELTIDETLWSLETEVGRPANEKKRINIGDMLDWGSSGTPSAVRSLGSRVPTAVGEVGFRGPHSPA